ncbi:ssl1498 family light-harvesting-like protein [Roseofilum sp. BLCC_M91]|uniref:Ssl1498 family light-harvesting-like protein n=1 Tax=Roseofilum halophilum BLCC-M91 TaxID=3022259 RepID=A0ABT7BGG6_9CYAN|nr:ssl1498 family light-harvesting-like protein [Roseofilum halophilum]MDJ1178277.1 ssl1498 family light-harvesting-like protein [Roseofilum halophilum BLCC-M91]
MYTTVNPEGQLNNYANEPQMYYAQSPNQEQQQRYLFQGAMAVLFVTALMLTSIAVS